MVNNKSNVLAKNSVFNLIYNILNLLFPLITAMYASRILLPEGMGKIAYAQNITSYFILFASLGLPTYGVREIAKASYDEEQKDKVFTELMTVNFILSAIASIVFLLFLYINKDVLDIRLFICCGLQLFLNFVNIDWLYRGVEEYVYIVCRSIAIKVLSLIALFIFVKNSQDYIAYALISSIALAGNYLFNIFHAHKFIHFNFKNIKIARHIKPLFVLGLAVLLSSIYSKIDITMLGMFYPASEIGLYSNAFRIVQIATSVAISITTVFLPRLSLYYQTDKNQFFSLLGKGINVISFFVFPITVGLLILAPNAVHLLFGRAFSGSIPTIRILSILILIRGVGDLLCYQLAIATGNENKRLPAYAMAALLNVILNYLLIPVWGRNGAAVASVFSEALLNVIQIIVLKKLIGYKIDAKPIFQGIVSSIIMGFALFVLLCFNLTLLPQTILAILFGGIIYIFINIVFRNEFVMSIIKR